MIRASARRATILAVAAAAFAASQASAVNVLVNPGFEAPPDPNGINSNVAGWTLINGAQRANFNNHTPDGRFMLWAKTFQPIGGGAEQVAPVVGGTPYDISSWFYFESGYPSSEAVTRMSITWLDAGDNVVGDPEIFDLLPFDVTIVNQWTQISHSTNAPAAASKARVFFGWDGGSVVSGQPQSVFIDDVALDGAGEPPSAVWIVDGSGDWNNGGNWATGQVPNGSGATAQLLGAVTSNQTIYTNEPITLGTLRFDNANTYVLTGAGTLTMQVPSGTALIDVVSGTQKINLPTTIASDTNANIAPGATLVIADPLTLAGGSTLNATGGGTLQIISTVTSTGGSLVADGGTLDAQMNLDGVALTGNNAQINLGASQTLSALAVNGGNVEVVDASSQLVVRTGSFSSSAGSSVDLNDNAMIVDYSGATPLAAVAAARDAGILTSSLLNANTAVAVVDNATLGKSSFAGQSVDATSLLITRALLGDADLSNDVGFADLLAVARNYSSTTAGWDQGDFDFDHNVGFTDLLALARNFGGSLLTATSDLTANGSMSGAFAEDLVLAFSVVPEPASLATVGAIAVLGLRRRR